LAHVALVAAREAVIMARAVGVDVPFGVAMADISGMEVFMPACIGHVLALV
jgi:hypothetical protein